MNHVLNDLGETVAAVGAPGSIERAKCEYPALVKQLTDLCIAESSTSGLGDVDSAAVIATTLHNRGICSELETRSLLTAAGFTEQNAKEIFGQLSLMNQDRDRQLVTSTLPAPSPSREHKQGPAY